MSPTLVSSGLDSIRRNRANKLSGTRFFLLILTFLCLAGYSAIADTVSVTISPTSVTMNSSQNQHFKATVTGNARNGVTWSASLGSVTTTGTYTAPLVSAPTTTYVTATSVVDPTKSATAVVTVYPPISVSVTPASASVLSAGTQQFSATVLNTTDTNVSWKTTAGSISPTGLFHAPSVTSDTSVVITATSSDDRTKTGTATVTVKAIPALSITTTSLPNGLTGVSYNLVLTATGGTAPYTWTVGTTYNGLPAGIALSSSGVLSGITQATGAFTFTAKLSDSSPHVLQAKQTLTLNVYLNLGGRAVPASLFNMHIDHPNTPWPSAAVAGQRFWDSGVDWALINTASGVYDWTLLDQRLTDATSNGADVLYNLGMTPGWAQCSGTTSSRCTQSAGCAFGDTSYGGGPGQCYWPADLNPDGTGANQYWKDWVTAVANHSVNSGVGHVKYYEIWNEPNIDGFWRGTTAQLVRMAQDAACIIKGVGSTCTVPGIDPKASIVTPSPALGGSAINLWLTDFLGSGGAAVTDVIGFHGYNGTNAEKIASLVNTVRNGAMTTYNLTSKPMFDTEFSWGNVDFPNTDEQAGFIGRTLLLHWSAGVSRVYWYAWDVDGIMWNKDSTGDCTTPDPSGVGFVCGTATAFTQVQNWLVGSTLSQPCASVGTVWTCTLTRPGGFQALAVWDTAQSCSNGSCTTSTYTFPPASPNYIHYVDLKAKSTSIQGKTVPIGYKPILLENQ
jgi:hypothetical protein